MPPIKRTNEFDRIIAHRIRARRLQMSISQGALGASLGVTFQQIQKYENGTSRVSAGRLVEIAKALLCTPESFLKDLVNGTKATQERGINFLQTREVVELTAAMERAKPAQRRALLRFLADII